MKIDLIHQKLRDAASTAYNILHEHPRQRLVIVHYQPTNSYYVLDQTTWLSSYDNHIARNGTPVFYGAFFELTQIALGLPLDIEQNLDLKLQEAANNEA